MGLHYGEAIAKLKLDIIQKAEIKLEYEPLCSILEYVDALEEFIDHSTEEAYILDEKEINFQRTLLAFLLEAAAKYNNTNIIQISQDKTMHAIGCIYAILGKCYLKGLVGLERDHKLAVDYLIKSSICKNPMGTFELAKCYELAIGTEMDLEQACDLYRASYKLGYIKGLHKYGLMLIKGNKFVKKNILNGFFILKQAVNLNSNLFLRPLYDLGMLYKSALCDEFNDPVYGFKLFLTGAKKGCKYCQFKLGEEWENGGLVEKDIETAFFWYKIAASNNLAEAQCKVAKMLFGIKSVIRNTSNDSEKRLFSDGKVVFVSMKKKDKFYNLSDLELAFSIQKPLLNFKKFYDDSVDRFKEGFKMANKAAINGHKEAILIVAEAFEKGIGVEKNLLESIWWYKIADSLGCENIREKMNLLENKFQKNKVKVAVFKGN